MLTYLTYIVFVQRPSLNWQHTNMGSIELKDGSSELKNSGGDVKVEAGEANDRGNGWT